MKKLIKFIILASLFLTACKPQNNTEPYFGEYVDLMAEGYCNHCCVYPETLEELLSLYQVDTSWMEFSNSDTIQTVLSFLVNEKDEITWLYCHPTSKTLAIGALYNDDTLFYKTGDWYLPYINAAVRDYVKYHLEYPKTIDDFLHFYSIGMDKPDFWAPECWMVMWRYLCDNRDELEWIVEDDSFLIKSPQDTILYEEGMASDVRCKDYLYRNRVIVFTDIHGKFDYNDEIRKSFLQGLKSVRNDFLSKNQCVKSPVYVIEYRREGGLSRFCENEDFSLDTKWFKEIEEYVSQFAQEHELQRILFYTPAY